MVLKLQNVEKHYEKFDLQCSLEVHKGCVTGLIGQNGAGKSTTFKAVLGLIDIDGGKIELFGKDIKKLGTEEREKLGVVLSDSGFSGYLCIKDLIPVMASMYPGFDKVEFEKRCRTFEIPFEKKIKEFSTGMKAKLKVLVAMSHKASLLILDEPTVGLDVMARNELLDMMREYMEDGESSILISSHISSDLEGLCDDIYMIHNGRIIMHEETDRLLSDYGVIKVTEAQYEKLDKRFIIKRKREGYGYSCLTNEKQFYLDNYPDATIERGNIDETIAMMIRGEGK
ncbi:ABC transporter ATP-binding protein [Muricomes sp. OA1]|uniref:ABC transporter ATP-binding protein n=1 Tax=Hungatella hathewayi TaxID=154046 RepID=A0A3E2WKU8_9FIRM|nr:MULTISPECIES: ABC transporter ATP-binding protein [Clostridia]MCH1974261.1 ABC transporter ATP-binding protein [Muricomes sp. OA1]RGC27321.1 ABC transporter ATP-binding protein [Hungatella hathewayi]GKH33036.1 ABC transporter [Faecalicatena contorta]